MARSENGREAERAIDDLFRTHGGRVYRYSLAVLGNHADAEDVTQSTFLSAYRALEQGVRPRKPESWLLAIASNAIKQRYRQESARPRQVELDVEVADTAREEDGPTVGELLAALAKIPPQQRQAIVLREFEGRSYAEIAEILGVTHSALETLLFRARRSLAEELESQLTCTEAQLAISRAADERLGRKERRRLREHLGECPDCARFARLQQRHRRALKGLLLIPVPLSFSLVRGIEGTASAATLPAAASVAATTSAATAVGAGVGTLAVGTSAGTTGGGLLAGGLALKAAAVVSAAAVTGGVAVTGSTEKIAPERRGNTPVAEAPKKTPPGKASLGAERAKRASGPARSAASTRVLRPGRSAERAPKATPVARSQRGAPGAARREGATRASKPPTPVGRERTRPEQSGRSAATTTKTTPPPEPRATREKAMLSPRSKPDRSSRTTPSEERTTPSEKRSSARTARPARDSRS